MNTSKTKPATRAGTLPEPCGPPHGKPSFRFALLRALPACALLWPAPALVAQDAPAAGGGGTETVAESPPTVAAPTAEPAREIYQILRNADRARGNLEGVSWKVEVRTVERGREQETTFDVKARGFDVLATTLRPRKSKGNKMLMHEGNMWFYKPGLSKPAAISQRQKLAGNAANGDIAATNYADDYTATRLPDQTVDGELCHVFDLLARDKTRCTYDRIIYYVSKRRQVGVKAEYYTVSGKILKSARMEYDNQVPGEGGKPQPFISRMVIQNELMNADLTALNFSDPSLREVPNGTFDVNLLTE